MYNRLRQFFFILLLSTLSISTFGQFFNQNPPRITGQRPTPLITQKNTPITIVFENLRVTDLDLLMPPYPQGYTLNVFSGLNYTLVDATVTPDANFVGTLTVEVEVYDGKFYSNKFDLKIDVLNFKPVITGHDPISIKEGTSFTLLLEHLEVTDEDNIYPDDFTLTVLNGNNYSVTGNTITPNPGFDGNLQVPVRVNDGHEPSDNFNLTIEVKKNIQPVIKSQVALSTNQGKAITILLSHLSVDDADNSYPEDFTLKIFTGPNYVVSGNSVTPNKNFTGKLIVPVSVHDGLDESKKFNLEIQIVPNVPPQITGQNPDPLVTNEDQNITITLAHLKVTDPGNNYPDDFTLKIPQGKGINYTVSGNTVSPSVNFFGQLSVPVRVNDGFVDSQPFDLSITVVSVNDPPVITGQDAIFITTETPTQLLVSALDITDADVENTTNFTLRILSDGPNYTASGNTITSTPGFIGKLSVSVVVNDGIDDSAPFNLEVEVIPKSVIPLITGQRPLVMNEDEPLTLKLEDLFVTDEDDVYPDDFTMKVVNGSGYTFEGLTVLPALNFNGLFTVSVTVNDGENESLPFSLNIYVIPVNDPPYITALEETPILYEPGTVPIFLTQTLETKDIDSDYLSFAEISFDSAFNALHDELIFQNTEKIRGIYDQAQGILSLIGNATLIEYDSAIRSVKYNYILKEDSEGNQIEVLPGSKYIRFTLSDGTFESAPDTRIINIESSVLLDIPNAFTPNNDDVNDIWKVESLTGSKQFDKAVIKVYSKRGLLIYESQGLDNGWDGFFNGKALGADTYYYTIDLNLSYTKKTYKGAVTILR